MSMSTAQEIKSAIEMLTLEEVGELRVWLDQYTQPQPIDIRLQADIEAGRLDKAIQRALDNEKNGYVQPL